ncbi:fumarylacetoacetate hydrolase family protein [Nocardioides nematodiphilus]|uniref:fumarylacetoacetate hydrolase family protein n=1 Tax=Nocardioides nematodiphilus TaxID=2849669 RepID=UPI001CDA0B65|nr:fumarylacetoacetate hydrolase family protein [Nocardioides nematodiphilus]MCA1983093.1 fumarylacetoacetate hydrolase family protein [Nocardioides nematodiphilus]
MKYMSFLAVATQQPTWGASVDGQVYDLGPTGAAVAPTLRDAIAAGLLADTLIDTLVPVAAESEVTFQPVIPNPGKIVCVGVNYRSHLEETGREEITVPTLFPRFADSQTGHLVPVEIPAVGKQFDYEGELAVIIGAPAVKVPAAQYASVIAGYSAYNDFTVRDWQRATSQWFPGKNFPGTGAMGPYFVPAGEIEDLDSCTLETRVNGEQRQKAQIADLRTTIDQLIEHISTFTPLAPGDIIVTGTPGGVGLFMDPPALLSAGDVVEVEITGLGVLRNEIVAEQA